MATRSSARACARCSPPSRASRLSSPEIGRELFISEATVKSHVTGIFGKLSVGDRTAAVTVAMARGILPPP